MAQEIIRELVNGVWRTVRRSQEGGGSQTLEQVLTAGADPAGHAITGALALAPTSTGAVALRITPPVGSSDNSFEILDKDNHANRLFVVNEIGELLARTNNGEASIDTNDNGTVSLEAGHSTGLTSFVVSSFDNIYVNLAVGVQFLVSNNAGDPIFAVDEATGAIHGKTGQALTFDL